jgi:hypothetical protein
VKIENHCPLGCALRITAWQALDLVQRILAAKHGCEGPYLFGCWSIRFQMQSKNIARTTVVEQMTPGEATRCNLHEISFFRYKIRCKTQAMVGRKRITQSTAVSQ